MQAVTIIDFDMVESVFWSAAPGKCDRPLSRRRGRASKKNLVNQLRRKAMKCSFISMATLVFLFASTQVPPASAQSECNSRQQALDRRMEDFDKRSRCTQGPSMTMGGPEWQACEREK